MSDYLWQNFEIIKEIYPEVDRYVDSKCYDVDDNEVVIDELRIAYKRQEIEAELALTQYQRDRAAAYPSIEEQLDKIYHSGINAWKRDIKAIKDAYPKPIIEEETDELS